MPEEGISFNTAVTEYEKAPKVTRQRLYIDTLQKVMSNTSKVMVDVDSGNIMYLPLDKLMQQSNNASPDFSGSNFSSSNSRSNQSSSNRSTNSRSSSRESR